MIYGVSRIFARAIVYMEEQMEDEGIPKERIHILREMMIRAYYRWNSNQQE